MKRFLTYVTALVLTIAANARIVEHTIDRGETLESIAKTYGVSTDSILKENPEMKDMFFAGMVIKIPIAEQNGAESTTTPSTTPDSEYQTQAPIYNANRTSTDSYTAQGNSQPGTTLQTYSASDSEITFDDFASIYLSYNAQFKYFDQGFYGIGYTMSIGNTKNFGLGYSLEANFGIVDEGASMILNISPYYGVPINKYFMPYLKLTGFYSPYQKDVVVGQRSYWSVNGTKTKPIKKSFMYGGAHLTPGVAIKFKPFVVYVGYELGFWSHETVTGEMKTDSGKYHESYEFKTKTKTDFWHRFTLSLGFNFR